ncbi:O-antigen ligase family protein, partial [Mangrovicoccus algicola]
MTTLRAGRRLPAGSRNRPRAARQDRPAPGLSESLSMPFVLGLFVFSITQPYLFNFGGFIMAPYRVLLMIMLVPLGLNWISGRYGGFILPDFLVLGHMLWMPVCMVVNGQGAGMPVYVFSQFIDIVGGYMLGRAAIRNKDDLVFFTRCLLTVLLILLPFAALESLRGIMLLNDIAQKLPLAEPHHRSTLSYPPRFGMLRAQTATPHPILYGITSAMAFSLGWLVLPHGRKPVTGKAGRLRWLGGSLGGSFFALSAGGWMNVMMQIGLMCYNRMFRGIGARWKLFLWGFAAFYVFLIFYSERPPFVVLSRLVALDQETAWFRFLIYQYGSAEVARHPIFGMGLFTDYIRPAWMIPSVDNHWLLQAMRWGWPGFLMLLGAAFYPVIKLGLKDFRGNAMLSDLRYAMIFAMVPYYVSMATVAVWNIQYSLIMLMMGACAWLIRAEPDPSVAETAETAEPEAQEERAPRSRFTRFPGRAAARRAARADRAPPARR